MIGQQLAFKHFKTDLSHLSLSVFPNQEYWLEQVIRYFSQNGSSLSLVIRIHPRLAHDKRGLPESPCLPTLWEKLIQWKRDESRIFLVHPSDPVSAYWLGLQADLILNGWSTIGLEFAIKGSVVTNAFYKCPLGAASGYPFHALTKPLKSENEYFRRIERLLLCIRRGLPLNKEDYISEKEASKAFLAAHTSGLVNISKSGHLSSQIASPSVLTPEMCSIML